MPTYQEFTSIVSEQKYLNDKVLFLRLKLITPNEINFKAGQYISLIMEPTLRRSYSIFSPPSQKNEIDLIIDVSVGGKGSFFLKNVKLNQELKFLGPLGNFTFEFESQNVDTIYFIATGTGIAPMHSMITHAYAAAVKFPEKNVVLLWGIPTKDDVMIWNEFAKIKERYPNFHFIPCVSREKVEGAFFGRVTTYIKEKLTNLTSHHFYVCGSRDMVTEVTDILTSKNVSPSQIITERY